MVQKIILKIVLSFVMRQLEKFREAIDWDKIEKDLDERVKKIIPGTWFDEEAVHCVKIAFDAIKFTLGQGDNLKQIIQLLVAKKNDEALALLKKLILGAWGSLTLSAQEEKVKELLVA